jgi:hypothetical protein
VTEVRILNSAVSGEIVQWTINNDSGTWTLEFRLGDGTILVLDAAAVQQLHEASGNLIKAMRESADAAARATTELARWKAQVLEHVVEGGADDQLP